MKASTFAVVLNLNGFTDQLSDVLFRKRDELATRIRLHDGNSRHCTKKILYRQKKVSRLDYNTPYTSEDPSILIDEGGRK
jgi:hypothetical protein